MFKVTVRGGTMTQEEINHYIFYTKKRFGTILPDDLEIILDVDGEYVNISYDPPFRLHAYRATDYLVNNIEKLGDPKQAEFREKTVNTIDG